MLADFAVLRNLTIHHGMDAHSLRRCISEGITFPSLRKLDIRRVPLTRFVDSELEEATNDFILSLPNLKSLRLIGDYIRPTVLLALSHCGASLEELYLPLAGDSGSDIRPERSAFVDIELLHCLQDKCPELRKVELCFLRSEGDCEEVALYVELGRHKSLRDIHLVMHSTADFLWESGPSNAFYYQSYDEWIMDRVRLEAGLSDEIRRAFMDLTMDETLAKAIFARISDAKPPYACPVEELTIDSKHPEVCGGYDIDAFIIATLSYVARSFVCLPSYGGELECLEYHRHGEDPDQDRRQYLREEKLQRKLLEEVLPMAWPEMKMRGWYNKWHSFPLAEG